MEQLITEIKTMQQMEALAAAIKTAAAEAMKYACTEDGGTCNFDECLLDVKIPKRIIDKSGAKLRKREYGIFRGSYELYDIPSYGQGNCRTRMARAACASLRNSGYSAFVHYQID